MGCGGGAAETVCGGASQPLLSLALALWLLAAGCEDYDTKPVDFTRLCAKIEALLPPR